ncbi:MAG: tetratricopeptide repeat protein [Elusimicrobia bacterium]|nr:tetratricopeptide repeat protein [Elusimicrobiota bacterium]
MALFNRGQYARAASRFEAALRGGETAEWLACALGQAYAAAGRTALALRLLRGAARRSAEPHPIYLALSDILRRAGQTRQAEAILRRLAAESSHLGQAHHALGQILLGQGRLDAAAASFRRAARLEPQLPWPHIALGELLERRGRGEEALRCWARAGRARLYDSATAVQLGDLYQRRGLAPEARRHYLRAWKLDGRSVAACQRLAEAAKGRGCLDEAALWVGRAGRLDPREALWDFRLGWIHGQAGRWTQMRRCLRRYLGRRARSASDGASPVLAWVCLQDYRRAAAEAERSLERLDPEGLALLSRAWPENWLRQHDDAFYAAHLRAVERQALARPRSPWPCFFRASLLLRRNRYAEAGALSGDLARFSEARYGWMRYVTGLALLLDCRYEAAVAEFAAALRSRPADWKSRCHLAEALLCLGRRKEAFERFDAAEADAARVGAACEVWAWRGEARLWLGQAAAALADLDRAVESGAKLALCWRGAAQMLMGRLGRARQDLDRAIVPGSKDAEAYLWRGELNRRCGRARAALRDLAAARRAGHGQHDFEWAACNRALLGAAPGEALRGLSPALLAAALGRPVPDLGDARAARAVAKDMLARARGLRRHEPYLRALWLGPEAAARLAR